MNIKRIRMVDKKLGELLVEWKVIAPEQLEKALSIQKSNGNGNGKASFSGEILIKLGVAKEENIVKALVVQYQFPYLPVSKYKIDRDLTKLIPENIVKRYNLVPLEMMQNVITIAMANPLDEDAVKKIEEISKCKVQIFMSSPSDIQFAIDKYYSQN
ncbi:MAG: hypothetical protein ABH848_01270 [Candidatus Omnitrophota bacterium]